MVEGGDHWWCSARRRRLLQLLSLKGPLLEDSVEFGERVRERERSFFIGWGIRHSD